MKLGEMLLRAGCITELQLKTALAEQQRWGGKLGKILVDMNYLSEDLLIKALARQLNVPRASLDHLSVPPQVLAKLDRSFCESNLCVPVHYNHQERALQVALFDPTNVSLVDELKFRTGLRVHVTLAGQKAIALAVHKLFVSESLSDGPSEEFKVTGNSGATLIKRVKDIKPTAPPAAAVPWQGQAPFAAPAGATGPPPAGAAAGPPAALRSGGAHATLPLPADLERAAKKQSKAMRVLLDLLLERGVLTQEEHTGYVRGQAG